MADYSNNPLNAWFINNATIVGMFLAYIILFLFAFFIWKNWEKIRDIYAERMVKVYIRNEQIKEKVIKNKLEKESKKGEKNGN